MSPPPSRAIAFLHSYLWSNYLMIVISWSRERGKLILRSYFPLFSAIFRKCFIVDVWRRRCLNKPWVWICQSSEYTRVLNMFLSLYMSWFWIDYGSKYARVTQGFEYAWIIPGYAWLCPNVTKSVWMAFVLHLPIVIPMDCFLQKWKFDFFSSNWRYLILFIVLD